MVSEEEAAEEVASPVVDERRDEEARDALLVPERVDRDRAAGGEREGDGVACLAALPREGIAREHEEEDNWD